MDLHADTLFLVSKLRFDIKKRHKNPLPRSPLALHVDLPRMEEGGIDCLGLALPLISLEALRRGDSIERSLEETRRWSNGLGGEFPMVDTVGAIEACSNEKKPCFFVTLEGAHGVPLERETISRLRAKGLAAITLAHLTPSRFSCPSTLARWSGRPLPEAGKRLIEMMEEACMVVDLAHLGRRSLMDALATCTKPPIISHTGLAGVKRMWRNVSDEAIRKVAELGGVIGVIFYPGFHVRSPFAGLECVVQSIRYLVDLVGEDFAGLGSDFDGWIPTLPGGLEDCSRIPALTDALLRSGLASEIVTKILGGNALRVLRHVWGC